MQHQRVGTASFPVLTRLSSIHPSIPVSTHSSDVPAPQGAMAGDSKQGPAISLKITGHKSEVQGIRAGLLSDPVISRENGVHVYRGTAGQLTSGTIPLALVTVWGQSLSLLWKPPSSLRRLTSNPRDPPAFTHMFPHFDIFVFMGSRNTLGSSCLSGKHVTD